MEFLYSTLAILISGRCVLSFLPPGRPGFHEPRELPATLASSWVLGLVALSVPLAATGHLPHAGWQVAAWALVILVKWKLGPGAMVPRHEPQREPLGSETWTLVLGLLVLFGLAIYRAQDPYSSPGRGNLAWVPQQHVVLGGAVLVALIVEGLRTMRRPMWPALLAAVLIFARPKSDAPFIEMMHTLGGPGLLAGGGAVFALASWKNADRRAMVLSVLCFADHPLSSLGGPHPAPGWMILPMLCGLGVLVSLQPSASRVRVGKLCTIGAVLGTVAFFGLKAPGDIRVVRGGPLPAALALALLPVAFAFGIRKREPEFVGLFLLSSALLIYGYLLGGYREFLGVAPLCIAVGFSRARTSTIESA